MSLKTRKRNFKNKKTKLRKNKKTKIRKNKKTKLNRKKKTRRRVKKHMKGGMFGMFKGKVSEVEKKEMETYIKENLPDEDFSVSTVSNTRSAGVSRDNTAFFAFLEDRKIDKHMQKEYLLKAYKELVTENNKSKKQELTSLFKDVVNAPLTNPDDDNNAKYKKAILIYQHINTKLHTFKIEQFKISEDIKTSFGELEQLKRDIQDPDMVNWLFNKMATTANNLNKAWLKKFKKLRKS